MHRILNKIAKSAIIESLLELREKKPEIDWDNPTGEIFDIWMTKKELMYPGILSIPSTYSTVTGIEIQLDHFATFGLVEHFKIGNGTTCGFLMRSYTVNELLRS